MFLTGPPPQLTADEDLFRVRVEHPVVAFTRVVVVAWYLEKGGFRKGVLEGFKVGVVEGDK